MEFLSNLHPVVIHFPVALLFTYGIIDIIGIVFHRQFLLKTALLLLILAVISAFLGVLTGNQAAAAFSSWTDKSLQVLNRHQTYASVVMWLSTAFLVLRIFLVVKKKFNGWIKYVFIVFALVLIFLLFKTGENGWEMVKKYGVGTDLKIEEIK